MHLLPWQYFMRIIVDTVVTGNHAHVDWEQAARILTFQVLNRAIRRSIREGGVADGVE